MLVVNNCLYHLWWLSNFQTDALSLSMTHYQCAWLASSCLIRFSVSQVVLSGLPWSTSPPILWAFSGRAVSMQSCTIKGSRAGLLQECGKVQLSLPLLILTNLVINGHSQAGSPTRRPQSPRVTLASLIIPISRDQSSEREVLRPCIFSTQESRKKKL